jgi:hypothetical protein
MPEPLDAVDGGSHQHNGGITSLSSRVPKNKSAATSLCILLNLLLCLYVFTHSNNERVRDSCFLSTLGVARRAHHLMPSINQDFSDVGVSDPLWKTHISQYRWQHVDKFPERMCCYDEGPFGHRVLAQGVHSESI